MSDISFQRESIRVRQGKERKDRLVGLPKVLEPALRLLLSGRQADSFVFLANGDPKRHVSPRTIERMVKRAASRAGIQRALTPHSLRHSFARHLLEDGVDIRFIQQLLGHACLETTSIYTQVAQRRDRQILTPPDSWHWVPRRRQENTNLR